MNISDTPVSRGELTCREFVEIVTDYLEGALPPVDRARFEEHLSYCPGCSTYLEQIRQTLRITGTLTEDAITGEARQQLLDVFRHWKHDSDAPEP